MKALSTIFLSFIISCTFAQVKIDYSTVFDKGTKLIPDLSYTLTIELDESEKVKSFSFQEIIQDSIESRKMNLKVTKTQPVFREGHAGILFHAFDENNKGYFVYMMDDYCIVNYLPEGKTKFSESKTLYSLMSGK